MIILRQNSYSKYVPNDFEDYITADDLEGKSQSEKEKAVINEMYKANNNKDRFNKFNDKRSTSWISSTAAGLGAIGGGIGGSKLGLSGKGKKLDAIGFGVSGAFLSAVLLMMAGEKLEDYLNRNYTKAQHEAKNDPIFRSLELADSLDKKAGGSRYKDIAMKELMKIDGPLEYVWLESSYILDHCNIGNPKTAKQKKDMEDFQRAEINKVWKTFKKLR